MQFRPGGFGPFSGVPADAFSNAHISLEDVWGSGARQLRDRCGTPGIRRLGSVSSKAHCSIKRNRLARDRAVDFAIEQFQASGHAGIAVRQLSVGRDVHWADLALSCGYFDQSHFVNDFRALSGINPTAYTANRLKWMNHVAVEA